MMFIQIRAAEKPHDEMKQTIINFDHIVFIREATVTPKRGLHKIVLTDWTLFTDNIDGLLEAMQTAGWK